VACFYLHLFDTVCSAVSFSLVIVN